MHTDRERCLRAVASRDARFDGWFVTGVRSTGIYCRPSCPAMTPKPENIEFFPSAVAAAAAGLRACRRCRPDVDPASAQWNPRADVVARAMRLIADGAVDRVGVPGLAAELGYSVRQLERAVRAECGATPLALARVQRAQAARLLLDATGLPAAEVAFAAGFTSVRSFNATIQDVFGVTPGALRRGGRHAATPPDPVPATVRLRLAHRAPLHTGSLFGHLAATAVAGVEEWREGCYRRTLRLAHGAAVIALTPGGVGAAAPPAAAYIPAHLAVADLRDLPAAISAARRLLDLDADPGAIDAALGADPHLAPLVAATPGRRVPGSVDAAELAVRAVIGQQVSTAAAATLAARLAERIGEPVRDSAGGLTRLFPSLAALAALDPARLGMPVRRASCLIGLAGALASGAVDLRPGADPTAARRGLLALPGIGAWTVEVVAMRGLADPDAFPGSDLGVVAAARRLGLPATPAGLAAHAERWRPWRAYAVTQLWGTGTHAANQLPVSGARVRASR